MKRPSTRLLKWAGLAGIVGVAATGVAIARDERARRAYTPQELRDRLRERYAAAEGGSLSEDRRRQAAARVEADEHSSDRR